MPPGKAPTTDIHRRAEDGHGADERQHARSRSQLHPHRDLVLIGGTVAAVDEAEISPSSVATTPI